MTDPRTDKTQDAPQMDKVFAVFNEIGIIGQLSNALLAQVLPDGVHPSHFAIMNHLVRMGDRKTPVALARAMQVTKNTMTHSLRVLEGKGFVTVTPNPDDARGKLVHLTEAGRVFHETARAQVKARFAPLISAEQFAHLMAALPHLTEIRKHLDTNRQEG